VIIVTSAPAVSSTDQNRLQVFARGRNNDLIIKSWNGSRWTDWQSLGGSLASEPGAVSWGGRRIDVFARGDDDHLYHIWRQ